MNIIVSRKVSYISAGIQQDYYPKGTEVSHQEEVLAQVQEGDKVTFRYIKRGKDFRCKNGMEIRIGTVNAVRGNSLLMQDDDRNGQYRSFSGKKMFDLCVL